MGRSSRCVDCGATVVVTRAKTLFRGGAMVMVCHPCAGIADPAAIPEGPADTGDDYDEVLVGIAADDDDIYDDVEVVVDDPDGGETPSVNGNVFNSAHDDTVSGAVDVEDRAPRQRDPTLPPVVIDKAQ